MELNKYIDTYHMNCNMEIRQEPCLLERTVDKVIYEPNVSHSSNTQINSEPSFASNFILHSDSNKEIDTNIEAREESIYWEIFPKLNSEPQAVHPRALDLYSDTQINATEADEEFLLSELTRVDAKTSWNSGAGVFTENQENGCCHEKPNTDVVQGFTNLRPQGLIPEHNLQFSCNRCDGSFTTQRYLRVHSFIHKNKALFKCDVCDKSFTCLEYLKAHYSVHQEKKLFKCNKCDETFTTAQSLKSHKLIHGGLSVNMCSKCGITFTTPYSLKRHNTIHEGQRPFKCSECDRSFNRAHNLKTHLRTHESTKPFKCSNCNKSYTSARSLRKHSEIH